jgi:2-dehydro-3-deoxyphosphogluconate aldolase/(4S)-4-hydroxy-2-oxoglutarate aldolase
MTRDQLVTTIATNGLMPCWRHDDASGIIDASKALADVGFNNVELTMALPGNLKLIERAAAELPTGTIVGVGTVLDGETARMAILAGARYVVSPVLVPEIITVCHRYGAVAIIGVSSPTEIITAKSLGADMLKIYPAGSGLIKHIQLAESRSVFPGIRTVVTGGSMCLSDIKGFMSAGADAAVVGMPTMAMEAYAARKWSEMQRVATRLLALVKEGRDTVNRQKFGQLVLARYTDLDGTSQQSAAAAR